MTTKVVVKLQVEGVHSWPECPYEQVAFLRTPHRHLFYIECEKEVSDADREIEIIMFKEDIKKHIESRYRVKTRPYCDFGTKSCEMIAQELLDTYALSRCAVLEDNENGAVVRQ